MIKSLTWQEIRHGDRCTVVRPDGTVVTGHAVMFNRQIQAWVLNTNKQGVAFAAQHNTKAVHRPRS